MENTEIMLSTEMEELQTETVEHVDYIDALNTIHNDLMLILFVILFLYMQKTIKFAIRRLKKGAKVYE